MPKPARRAVGVVARSEQPATTPAMPNEPTTARRESDIAYRAYLLYESLGLTRTYPALVAALRAEDPGHYSGTDATLLRRMKQWSADHGWRARVRQYDREQETLRRLQAEEARRVMNDGQAQVASQLYNVVARRIAELLAIDQASVNALKKAQELLTLGQEVPESLRHLFGTRPALAINGQVLAQLYSEAVNVERLARGAATEIAQGQGEDDAAAAAVQADSAVEVDTGVLFYFPAPATPPDEPNASSALAVDAE